MKKERVKQGMLRKGKRHTVAVVGGTETPGVVAVVVQRHHPVEEKQR